LDNHNPSVAVNESGECLTLSMVIVSFILIFSVLLVGSYHDNVIGSSTAVDSSTAGNKEVMQPENKRIS